MPRPSHTPPTSLPCEVMRMIFAYLRELSIDDASVAYHDGPSVPFTPEIVYTSAEDALVQAKKNCVESRSAGRPMDWIGPAAHVCSSWREVAMGDYTLWSVMNVDLTGPNLAREMITWSNEARLTPGGIEVFVLQTGQSNPTLTIAESLGLLEHVLDTSAPSIQTMRLFRDDLPLHLALLVRSNPMPELHHLDLELHPTNKSVFAIEVNVDSVVRIANRLERLRLIGLHLAVTPSTQPLHHLTDLEIDARTFAETRVFIPLEWDVVIWLSSLRSLERLSITDYFPTSPYRSPVCLPASLKVIRLTSIESGLELLALLDDNLRHGSASRHFNFAYIPATAASSFIERVTQRGKVANLVMDSHSEKEHGIFVLKVTFEGDLYQTRESHVQLLAVYTRLYRLAETINRTAIQTLTVICNSSEALDLRAVLSDATEVHTITAVGRCHPHLLVILMTHEDAFRGLRVLMIREVPFEACRFDGLVRRALLHMVNVRAAIGRPIEKIVIPYYNIDPEWMEVMRDAGVLVEREVPM